jgi:hypothetical protein
MMNKSSITTCTAFVFKFFQGICKVSSLMTPTTTHQLNHSLLKFKYHAPHQLVKIVHQVPVFSNSNFSTQHHLNTMSHFDWEGRLR